MTDFKQYLLDEFVEDYQEGLISRREALKLIAGITGSVALASSLLAACAPPAQPAATALPTEPAAPTTAPTSVPTAPSTTVPPTAEPTATTAAESTAEPSGEIEARDVQFEGNGATLLGYWAKPTGGGPYPIVLVCHENRGLADHIKDVTRRFAKAGYAALAVDLLSRQGGTAGKDSSSVPGLLSGMPQDQFVQDFISGLRYAQQQPGVQADRVGMTGFCFGGPDATLHLGIVPAALTAAWVDRSQGGFNDAVSHHRHTDVDRGSGPRHARLAGLRAPGARRGGARPRPVPPLPARVPSERGEANPLHLRPLHGEGVAAAARPGLHPRAELPAVSGRRRVPRRPGAPIR